MLNFTIVKKVVLEPLTQEWLEEAVREKLQRDLPQEEDLVIGEVKFIPRRNPHCIEAEVDVRFASEVPYVKPTTKPSEPVKEEEVTESNPFDTSKVMEVEVKDEPVKVSDTPKGAVANIFANS